MIWCSLWIDDSRFERISAYQFCPMLTVILCTLQYRWIQQVVREGFSGSEEAQTCSQGCCQLAYQWDSHSMLGWRPCSALSIRSLAGARGRLGGALIGWESAHGSGDGEHESPQIYDAPRGLLSLGILLLQTVDEAMLVGMVRSKRNCGGLLDACDMLYCCLCSIVLMEHSRCQVQRCQRLHTEASPFVGITASEIVWPLRQFSPLSSTRNFVPAAGMRFQVVLEKCLMSPEPVGEIEQYPDLVASLLLSSWELLCHRIEGIDYLPPHAVYSTCPQECPATLTSRSQDTLLATVPRMPYNLVARYREWCVVVMYWGYHIVYLHLASQLVYDP